MQRRDETAARRAVGLLAVGILASAGVLGCERDSVRSQARMQAEQIEQNGERQAEQVRRAGQQEAERLRQQADLLESRSKHEAERIQALAEDQARATRRHPNVAEPIVTAPSVNSPALTAPAPAPSAVGGGPTTVPVNPAVPRDVPPARSW